jgi:hypothetical protein
MECADSRNTFYSGRYLDHAVNTTGYGESWHFEKNGQFFVWSAEREAWLEGKENSSAKNEQKCWSSLWKVKVPAKIRIFLWRLSHQSLPTGLTLHNQKNGGYTCLCIVPFTIDSWRHSLLECNMPMSTWILGTRSWSNISWQTIAVTPKNGSSTF